MLGLVMHPFFYSVLLFDVVYREETLLNVIRSVTRNGRSIILTAVLALILVYMFSIIGYMFFKDDFIVTVKKKLLIQAKRRKERACDSLRMCIVTTLNQGLRNGGGIGDILRAPSSEEALFVARVTYDLLFFLRSSNRTAFDNKIVNFEDHIKNEHNMWHYLYFIVLIKVKDPTEFTGPESYVSDMVKVSNLEWFPRLRAISLAAVEKEG
ncbi:hypothetical protein NQ318_003447 [Aromia moschata]|uniref:Ion transport domain-containing protein n=1 Tax=Aromia moschata TaxID=1265417 RepID=A0AAV8YWH4_9CUCU|nr:hypothetical protein NQ318_003447 [Aromia moschata]